MNAMGGACCTYRARRGVYWVLVGKPEGKNHLEDPDIDGKITLKWIYKKWDGGLSSDLAQNRDR
jgi:hypothetical protein